MVATASTSASAEACARGMSPARPSSRAIAIGSVSSPLRLKNVVAPNSPNDTAAAKHAPTSIGRRNKRTSISHQARIGDAPNTGGDLFEHVPLRLGEAGALGQLRAALPEDLGQALQLRDRVVHDRRVRGCSHGDDN